MSGVLDMDIYKLQDAFWVEHLERPFNRAAISLFFYLIYRANKQFWKGPLRLSWRHLEDVLGMSSETLSNSISDLKSRRTITYERKGKYCVFWFPEYDCFAGRSDNRINDRTNDRSDNRINDRSINNKYINTVILEDNNNNITPNGVSDKVASTNQIVNETVEVRPSWYQTLSSGEKDIVDLWEYLLGPFDESWLEPLRRTLRICYPAQVKNAITVMAKTKPEALQSEGFPYLLGPLERGAFGKKRKQPNGTGKFENKLQGLVAFVKEAEKDAGS